MIIYRIFKYLKNHLDILSKLEFVLKILLIIFYLLWVRLIKFNFKDKWLIIGIIEKILKFHKMLFFKDLIVVLFLAIKLVNIMILWLESWLFLVKIDKMFLIKWKNNYKNWMFWVLRQIFLLFGICIKMSNF